MSEEERFEAIHLIIKAPKTDKENDSWFDRIFDLVTSYCTSEEADECECGMESMGGSGGTLEQCYDYERLTEKWAMDVEANDLKVALSIFDSPENDWFKETPQYERLRKAAYWHDDFNEWVANLPDDEELEELEEADFILDPEVAPYFSDEPLSSPMLSHLEHYQTCNCLADSGTCCREGCWCWEDD